MVIRSRHSAAKVEAKGTAFDMRTNLNQAPNSQGTLFQGGKPANEHRWPRGYSPTRMAAVKNAVPIRVTHKPEALYKGDVSPDGGMGTEFSHPYLNADSTEHTKRMIREPLARSTHSIEDLASLGGIHANFGATGIKHVNQTNAAAYYTPSTQGITLNPRRAHGTGPGEEPMHHYGVNERGYNNFVNQQTALPDADATMMHEFGHHMDHRYNKPALFADLAAHGNDFERHTRGLMESNADTSMLQHFRNDPRNKTGFDVHSATYGQSLKEQPQSIPRGYQDPSKHAGSTPTPPISEQHPLWSGTLADMGVPEAGRLGYNGRII